MSATAARYLGFAFASADLLVELSPDGGVAFAMGAARRICGREPEALPGLSWRELVADADHAAVSGLLQGLGAAGRGGPLRLRLRNETGDGDGVWVRMSACRMPELGGAISCALSLDAAAATHAPQPLRGRDDFLADVKALLAAPAAGGLDVELVELTGLEAARSRCGAAAGQALLDEVAAVIRAESWGGDAAAQLSDDRFALVRDASRPRSALVEGLQRVAAAADAGFVVKAEALNLPKGADPAVALRALRFAVQTFVESGAEGAKAGFERSLRETLAEAEAFSAMVRDRRFKLAYQPIVRLENGELSHYEVLARFGEGSPQRAILMAEAFDLIEGFDLAVADICARQLREQRQLRLAVNLSACSLMNPGFLDRLWSRLGRLQDLAGRLKFELTESADVDDLEAANRLIQQIRAKGFAVCLDDFGAGSASLAYLQQLAVDTVKIDGQYVRELTAGGRDSAVVRHLVQLCRELKVTTIAEMVETAEVAEVLLNLGVDCGQGWLFGKPAGRPEYRPTTGFARRLAAG